MKKLLSYFLTLAIILSAFVYLPNIGTSVMATETVEDLLIHDGRNYDDFENVVIYPGASSQRTFDFDGAMSTNHLIYRFNNGIDLSDYNQLKLDLTLVSTPESYDMWKDSLKFIITVGGTIEGTAAGGPFHDGTNYTWPVPASLEKGTNEITLSLQYLKDLGVDLSNVTRFGVGSFTNNFYWRTDGVTLEGNYTQPPYNKSAYYSVEFGATSGSFPSITQDMTIALRDIYAVYTETELINEANEITLSNGGYGYIAKGATRLAANGSGSDAIAYDIFDEAVDASSMEYIEFDFFISDLEAFRAETKSGASGSAYNLIVVKINSQGRMTNTGGDPKVNITGFHAPLDGYTMSDLVYLDNQTVSGDEYISNSGWTHIIIPISSLSATAKTALANFKSLAIGFSPVGQATDALTQNYSFGFKNLKVTNGDVSITESFVDENGNIIAEDIVTEKVLSATASENIFTTTVSEIEGYKYIGYSVDGGDIIKSSDISVAYYESGSLNIEYVYRKVVEDYLIHDGRNYDDFEDVVIYPGANSQRTFDFDGAMSTNHLIYRFNNGIDLSDYNELKLDLTLVSTPESYDMWKDSLKFIITVGGTIEGTAAGGPFHDGTNYTWPVPASLEEGTNEITLSLQYLKDLGVDLSNVTRFGVGSFTDNFYWRTDGVTLEGSTTQAPYNKSAYYSVAFGATSSSFPSITQDMTIALRDIYAVYTETELINEANEITLSNGGYGYIAKGATRLAANGSGSDAIAYDIFDEAVDASSMEYIEFDFFISDLEAFRAETKSGASGNAYNLIVVKINSQGRMTNTGGDPKVNITGFHVALDGYTMSDLVYLDNQTVSGDEYISNSGWTHIRIPISSLSATAKTALANFKSLAIGFSPVGQATDALTQNYSFGFKNLKVTNGIPGDVNDDTEVDARDLVRFKKYLAGVNVDFDTTNGTLGVDYSFTQSMTHLRNALLGDTKLTR